MINSQRLSSFSHPAHWLVVRFCFYTPYFHFLIIFRSFVNKHYSILFHYAIFNLRTILDCCPVCTTHLVQTNRSNEQASGQAINRLSERMSTHYTARYCTVEYPASPTTATILRHSYTLVSLHLPHMTMTSFAMFAVFTHRLEDRHFISIASSTFYKTRS